MKFVYSGWFRDNTMDPDDQDFEWVACIIINANKIEDAQKWGDILAKRYSRNHKDQLFLFSEVMSKNDKYHEEVKSWDSVPEINYGENATDEKIGW